MAVQVRESKHPYNNNTNFEVLCLVVLMPGEQNVSHACNGSWQFQMKKIIRIVPFYQKGGYGQPS